MKSFICKECNYEIHYSPCVNFIVFCPKCLAYAFLECEYGYGPVVPCHILCGENEIGIVTQRGYAYILQLKDSNEIIELEKEYLEALEESIEIIKEKMKNNLLQKPDIKTNE